MVTEKDVLDALATVAGPDGRTCVSRTNGISGLTIRDGKLYLALAGDRAWPRRWRRCAPKRSAR